MLTRLCCVFFLLVSPAAALEITSDFTLDYDVPVGDAIQVRGDSVLTIDGSPMLLAHVNLWDNSSLVFKGGDLRADIRVLGDNKIDFIGGRFVYRLVRGDGDAVINIDGETTFVGTEFSFPSGSQVIDIRSFLPGSTLKVIRSPNAFVNVFSDTPYYGGANRTDMPARLGAVDGGLIEVYSPTQWLVHASDGRPAGDTNSDGVVDLTDLNNVRNAFGQSLSSGDTLPLDGIVDLNDLNVVRNLFGQSTPVPEPSTFALLSIACLLGQVCHRRKSRRS